MAENNTNAEVPIEQGAEQSRFQIYKTKFEDWYVKTILRREEPLAFVERLKNPRTIWQSLLAQSSPRWLGIALGLTGLLVLLSQGLHWFWQLLLIILLGFVIPKLLYRFNQQFAEEDNDELKNYPGKHLIGKIITLEEDILAGESTLELEEHSWLIKGSDAKEGEAMQIIAVSDDALYLAPAEIRDG